MNLILGIALTCLGAGLAGAASVDDVDPFIGTGGHGHTYPGATLPFGMVQLSPDTRLEGWDGCSGYHFTDTIVYGFSHTHLSGTGVSDYGDILLMPRAADGPVPLDNGLRTSPEVGYASRFEKSRETAAAGTYSTHLSEYGIDVDLTATRRTGWHRYRFPADVDNHVVLDLTHRDETMDSRLRRIDDTTIEGYRFSRAWAQDQRVFFRARFSRPFALEIYRDGERVDSTEASGTDVKAVLRFGDDGGELIAQVAISGVDLDGARRNLEAEAIPMGFDFDRVQTDARAAWEAELARIEVDGLNESQRVIFATALYHSFLAPNTFSDVDGRYRGMDGATHTATGREHYTVFSLWDTFRSTHPLFTLVQPRRVNEMVATMLDQFDQYGRLPVWELAGNETNCMIGYHSVSVIADAWAKGIRDYDGQRALDAMVTTADADLFGLTAYRQQGFLGQEDESESVSKTLEYAYDDWCIARMAQMLDRPEVARRFGQRSQAWRHLLDPETGFLRPRTNQQWLTPFDPRRVDINFTEANAWQYRFFVPHDVEGQMAALGGEEAFVRELDALFTAESNTTGRDQVDITGLIGQYAHGNEPSHHMAWLYHYAGQPHRSAERVREILDTMYQAAPDGLSGNEDCGQMSSWYVLAALGLYPVSPGEDTYLIAPPLMSRAVLNLESGRTFTIIRSGEGPFVHDARLNGEPLPRSFLTHAEIAAGGELSLRASQSRSAWGTHPKSRPRSGGAGVPVLAAPYVLQGDERFRDYQVVAFAAPDAEAKVRYRSDDESPWQTYSAPLPLDESRTFQLQAVRGEAESPVVRTSFHEIPNDFRCTWEFDPHLSYTAGGEVALVDGLRGFEDWRKGRWVGFDGTDGVVVLDLREPTRLSRVGAGLLQDMRSWIFMPSEVVFHVSDDGRNYRELGRVGHSVRDDVDEMLRRDLWIDAHDTEARFLKVVAVNYGTIPEWHPGRGGDAFVFMDEILIETADR